MSPVYTITFSPGASVSWQWVDSTKVRGTPNPSLEPGTNYTVTIHASVGNDSLRDIVGHLFDGDRNGAPGGDFQWSFETGDADTTLGWEVPYQWDGARVGSMCMADLWVWDHLFCLLDPLFPFCGWNHNFLDASESGSIWFDEADDTCHFDLPSAAGQNTGVIAVHNDCIIADMVTNIAGTLWVKYELDPPRYIVEWGFTDRNAIPRDHTNFEAVLFTNGWIRFDYEKQEISDFHTDAGSGISCGDNTHYVDISPIYNVAQASYMFGPNVPPGSPGNLDPMPASVGLRWDPNPESDLKGYYMYRASGADTTDTASLSRLCDTAITAENFVDSLALPCSTYWYAVSAADTHWFEGALSNKVLGVVPPVPNAGSTATAYNTSRKIAKDNERSRFYVAFTSSDSVWVTFTDCEGCLWEIPYALGEGKLPAIAVDHHYNSVWVVWIGGADDEVVFYSMFNGANWSSPDTLFDFKLLRCFGSLSFAMDSINFGNVLVDQVYDCGSGLTPPTSFSTFLIRFRLYLGTPEPWVTTIRRSPWLDARSSIDCDDKGNLHVAWDEGSVISYRKGVVFGDSVIWEDPRVISAPAVPSRFPCIEYDSDSVSVVWQGQVAGKYQIFHRRKTLEDTLWLSIERVDSAQIGYNTYDPAITGGSHAVWAQEPDPVTVWSARREGTSWTDREAVKWTPYDSRFPHAVSYQGDTEGYLLVCWTEDVTGPEYGIDNARLQASSLSPTTGMPAQVLRASSRPKTFRLNQNAPNPFAWKTHMAFTLPKTEDVVLDIYNVAGQRVRRLVNGRMKAGRYEMVWDGTDERMRKVGSGTYFAKLVAGSFQKTRKMVLVR